ncbi:MAG: hypothetical protein ACXWCX_23205 [Burkholderiales bacterium]
MPGLQSTCGEQRLAARSGLFLLHKGAQDEAVQEYKRALDHVLLANDLKTNGIDDLEEALSKNPDLAGTDEILAILKAKHAEMLKLVGLNESDIQSVIAQ